MKNIEILAPAGSPENFMLAIHSGANAVYLGMKNFNARNKAENFNEQNLRENIKTAHLFGVKVYLTVNTLIKNEELEEFLSMCKTAVEAKVDAFIVQDFGVAKLLKDAFPNIVLHASTQLGVHNVEGAHIAKKLGFSRIILSRETTLEDIKEIKNNVDIEIEYFVQGALCVAFSGNCYLSSLKFSQSGNRGKCLQLCRLPYSASVENKNVANGYLLSTNDLSYIGRLKELVDAGVTSFKIEGRLRRGAYVVQAVQSYVKALNELGYDYYTEKSNLAKIFSRGKFNEGYYMDNDISKDIINPSQQNHRGTKIGKVIKVCKFKDLNKITIKTDKHKVMAGDGLKFIGDREYSMGVGNANMIAPNTYDVFSKCRPSENSDVYLTLDSAYEKKLLKVEKRLKVKASFFASPNNKAILNLEYGDIFISTTSEDIVQEAQNAPLTYDSIKSSLDKLVDTHFELESLNIQAQNVFMPKSSLNQLRRNAILSLQKQIIERFEKGNNAYFNENFKLNLEPTKSDYKTYYVVNDKIELPENCSVIISPKEYSLERINSLVNFYKDYQLYLNLPIILRNKDRKIIKDILKSLDKNIGLYINNIAGFYFEDRKIIASHNLNATNYLAVIALKNLGAFEVERSIEDDLSANLEGTLKYSGKPTLMTLTHCPFKTIFSYNNCQNCKHKEGLSYTAENGSKFAIRRTKIHNCYFELISDTTIESEDASIFDMR